MRQAPTAGMGPGQYGAWSGYGPGVGPQSGGGGSSGNITPGMGHWTYDVEDPFYRSGFTGADQRFQSGHRFNSIDPNFFYGRKDWQETQKSPEYQQWYQQAKQKAMLIQLMRKLGIGGMNLPNPYAKPPQVETQWDDVLRSLGAPGPIAPYWRGFRPSPPQSDRPNYW